MSSFVGAWANETNGSMVSYGAMDEARRGGSAASKNLAWCVADPHIKEDDPVLGLFYGFLEEFSSNGPKTLVVLGDLFAAWVALPGALAPYQRALLDKFSALRASGRELVFIVGNRDYFVESLDPQPFSFAGAVGNPNSAAGLKNRVQAALFYSSRVLPFIEARLHAVMHADTTPMEATL